MNTILAAFIIASVVVPLDSSRTRILNPDGSRCELLGPGLNYKDADGQYQQRDERLIPCNDMGFGWKIAASDHQLYCPTDEWRFRVEAANNDDGLEYEIADVGIHYYDPDTGSDAFQSFGWEQTAVNPTVEGNVWTANPYSGIQYTVVSGWLGAKTNVIWDVASMDIPLPTDIVDATCTMENSYISMVYDVHGWPVDGAWIDDQEVPDNGMWYGYAVDFEELEPRTFSIPPTQGYRDPTVRPLGDHYSAWTEEADVLYYIDRLNNRLYVDVPYSLFLDADIVLVDPTTWAEGQGGFADVQALYFLQDDQDRQKSDGTTGLIYENGVTPRWMCIIFSGLSSIAESAIVSEASISVTAGAVTDNPSWVHMSSVGCATTPVAKTPVADYNPLTDPADHLQNYPTGYYFNWYHGDELWGKPNNGPPADTYVSELHREHALTAVGDIWTVSGTTGSDIVNAVQGMVSNTSGDAFIIWGESNDCWTEIYNHGVATTASRPQLSVTYTVPDLVSTMSADQMWAAKGSAVAKMITNPTTNPIYSIVEINNVTLDIVSATAHYELTGADFDLHAATEVLPGQYLLHFVDSDFGLSSDAVATVIYEPTYSGGGSYVKSNPYTLDYGTTSTSSSSSSSTAEKTQQGNSIVCLDTIGTSTMVVTWPNGVKMVPGAMVEITAESITQDITPAIAFSIKNNLRNAIATYDGPDGTVSNLASTTTTYTDAAGNTIERVRIRYTITEANAEVSGGTGTLTVDGSAITEDAVRPFIGVNPLLTFPATWDDIDEVVKIENQVIVNQARLLTEVDEQILGPNLRVFKTSTEIDPGSGVYTIANVTAGYALVPVGAPACWVEVSGGTPINIQYAHYPPGATSSPSWLSEKYTYGVGVFDETKVVENTAVSGTAIYWASQ